MCLHGPSCQRGAQARSMRALRVGSHGARSERVARPPTTEPKNPPERGALNAHA